MRSVLLTAIFVGATGTLPESCAHLNTLNDAIQRRERNYKSDLDILHRRSEELRRLGFRKDALEASIAGRSIVHVSPDRHMDETIDWFEWTLEHLLESELAEMGPAVTAFVNAQSREFLPLFTSLISTRILEEVSKITTLSANFKRAEEELLQEKRTIRSLAVHRNQLLSICLRDMGLLIGEVESRRPVNSPLIQTLREQWNTYLQISIS